MLATLFSKKEDIFHELMLCFYLQDTGMNTDEFPRGFIKGCFEGFWWAFISMTTVGYRKALYYLSSIA